MDTLRSARFAAVVADIQKRWGNDALVRLSDKADTMSAGVPTGFAPLDSALVGQGLPQGHFTEVAGAFSSGVTTLILSILGHGQAVDDALRTAYIDMTETFDPAYAARCGVMLSRLLLVRPATLDEAFDICGDLIARYGARLLLIDLSLLQPTEIQRALLRTPFRRLQTLLRRSLCVAVCLVRPGDSARRGLMGAQAAVCLLLEKARWIQRRGQIEGCETRLTILKQTTGPTLIPLTLRLRFP